MSHDLELRALLRSFTARLTELSYEEARLLDVAWTAIEQVRGGGDRQWQRRIATGPGDVDRSFHLAKDRLAIEPHDWAVITACKGSWPFDDRVEVSTSPPLSDRCPACWRAAVGGSAIGMAMLEVARQLAIQDAVRAAQHEQDRAEVVGRVVVMEPAVIAGRAVLVEVSTASEFDAGQLTKVGGAEPYEVEIERGEGP